MYVAKLVMCYMFYRDVNLQKGYDVPLSEIQSSINISLKFFFFLNVNFNKL